MKKLTFFFVLYAGFIFSSDKRPQLPDKIYDYYILHKKATECINLIDTINNFRPESSIHWLRVSTAFDCLAIKMQLGFRESEELKEELFTINKIPTQRPSVVYKRPFRRRVIVPPPPLPTLPIDTNDEILQPYRLLPISPKSGPPSPVDPDIFSVRTYTAAFNVKKEVSTQTEEFAPDPLIFDQYIGDVPEEITDLQYLLQGDVRYARVGVERPLGVLLYGAPGTGKTLLIKELAKKLKAHYIYRSGSSFINRYIGVGASAVRDLFKEAKLYTRVGKLVLIFLDEVDILGQARDSDKDNTGEEGRTLSELLTIMDGGDDLAIDRDKLMIFGATNRPKALDEALTRPGRFDTKIEIKLPDDEKRSLLFKYYIYSRPRAMERDAVNLKFLAESTKDFNCAEIKETVNSAARFAARAGKIISAENFKDAIGYVKNSRIKREDSAGPAPDFMYS
ncbi:hypothetical protein A3F66_06035 [candidate division TM6 bacterium RIFCSPHIGHO2_12_FULL_32_22]|nr:MAG: hypothetical protein A3F66_06035 [candidate division TM6 bacterium RIFCSPHIGHO2_12_FULL_32_22]